MNKQTKYSAKSLRFRRWSRAGYAVFVSLTCAVSIGTLSVSVSDKSSLKADAISTLSQTTSLNNDREEEAVETTVDAQLLTALVVSVNSTDIAAAHCLKKEYSIQNG